MEFTDSNVEKPTPYVYDDPLDHYVFPEHIYIGAKLRCTHSGVLYFEKGQLYTVVTLRRTSVYFDALDKYGRNEHAWHDCFFPFEKP